MAWTSPKTWNVAEKLTAANFNTQIRDNLNALYNVLAGTTQAFGHVLYPTTDSALYVQDATSGIGGPLLSFDTNDYLAYTRADNTFRLRVAGADALTVDSSGNATASGQVRAANDGLFYLAKSGANPIINLDSNDFIMYDRTNNIYNLYIGGTAALAVSAAGKLTGPGFYDSGEFTVTNGSTVTLTTGWPSAVGPRMVWGLFSAVSSNENTPISNTSNATSTVRFGTMTAASINVVNASTGATQYCRVWAML